ncbi:MAG: hypothetical protein R3D71_04105 [Rickettsiales bacterium]
MRRAQGWHDLLVVFLVPHLYEYPLSLWERVRVRGYCIFRPRENLLIFTWDIAQGWHSLLAVLLVPYLYEYPLSLWERVRVRGIFYINLRYFLLEIP